MTTVICVFVLLTVITLLLPRGGDGSRGAQATALAAAIGEGERARADSKP